MSNLEFNEDNNTEKFSFMTLLAALIIIVFIVASFVFVFFLLSKSYTTGWEPFSEWEF